MSTEPRSTTLDLALVSLRRGILVLVGLPTWLASLLLAIDMLGALLLVRLHKLDAHLRGRGAAGAGARRAGMTPRAAVP